MVSSTLKHQLRNCGGCLMSESCSTVRFQVCAKCKTTCYCSRECQRADWPIHKPLCNQRAQWFEPVPNNCVNCVLSADTVHTMLQDWTVTYRPLMVISLINAMGRADGYPTPAAFSEPPQVFFVKLAPVPKLTADTKPRAAFTIKHAEALSLDEFRTAAVQKSHRLYNEYNTAIVENYESHRSRVYSSNPNWRLTMVVQSVGFCPHATPMLKNWFFEDDRTRDWSTEWKPDNWLAFLKETVARGKGWNRDDIQMI
ncbi:hypothetical protein GALMADRAFT_270933 [Galerina marginata CBS 339.88]|uniref:MYND-type domain-containing protein n=1 Tax=Galerina marginata (strain CBS 339.88) TaxID=685588 RepID=A0A067SLL6_GALM3|nr:hypothetical protein GALMADRAFT_270933 [Galerina marginata CBS 339.88]